ncbi:MAG: DUF3429 domain-containing protein [Pelomonas sp.]|nr:DUF3429 domain-containing protein [Roseateles sp.]
MNTAVATAAAPDAIHPRARGLAVAGLAPFVLLTLLVWLVGDRSDEAHAFVSRGLALWAALVVSFLGAIHWGLAMHGAADPAPHYASGVLLLVPAWIGAVMPPYSGLVVEGVCLVVAYLLDRRHYPALGAAGWLNLRFRLSAIAALCCFLGAAGC